MLEGPRDTDAGPPRHSTDKRQWWDGSTWLPAYSPDGKWWFDGTRWTLAPHRLRWPKWLVIALVIWSVGLVAWLPVAVVFTHVSHRPQLNVTELAILGALLGVGLVSTVVLGFILGRRGLWKHMAAAAAIGTAVLMLCYVMGTVAMAEPDGSGSNVAAVGFVVLSIPTLLVIGGLLFIGGGIGWLFRRRPHVI